MRREIRERLAHEAAIWRHSGLIDDELAELLAERYGAGEAARRGLLRWLGLFGILTLGAAILAWVGVLAAESGPLQPILLLAGGAWLGAVNGARLARDPRQRHPVLGSALITAALIAAGGFLALLGIHLGLDRHHRFPLGILILISSLALVAAYRLRLRWPLLLGVLAAFHAVGAWHAYIGDGWYVAEIPDEALMSGAAVLAICVGLWHETALEAGPLPQHLGFGRVYLIVGLLYLNLSLWFRSLDGHDAAAVLLFTGSCIAQIVLGGVQKDSRLTGFGIVFLGIDLYTRYFEQFWDRLSLGGFFLLGGLGAMALGYLFERRAAAVGPAHDPAAG